MSQSGDKKTKSLTAKQARFVEEYLVDLNATQAAIRAGYSEARASEIGYQLLQKTPVTAEIEKAQAERSKRVEVTQDDVIRLLYREAEGEGADTTSSARVRATELLGRHLNLFEADRKANAPRLEVTELSDTELYDRIERRYRALRDARDEHNEPN